jgi:hypothetical protein
MIRSPLAAASVAALSLACGPSPGARVSFDTPTAADLGTDQGTGRSPRRMDLDQLQRSILAVTGVPWTEVVDGETVDLFERLSGSLGKPDYKAATEEDLSPGLLFQKFLTDAAQATCTSMIDRERASGGERHLLVTASIVDTPATGAARIDADLRRALLVFHGRDEAPGSPELIRWRWLWDGVYADTGSPELAWTTVCVGLITHPAFYAY